jgi:type IV pilus assembly protein PilB
VTTDAKSLGVILVEEGLVTDDELTTALTEQQETGATLQHILVADGVVGEGDLARALARRSGVPFVDLEEINIDPAAVALVPEHLIQRYTVLPIGFDGGRLVLAMADPSNVLAVDDVRSVAGHTITVRVATTSALLTAIRAQARFDESVSDLAEFAAADIDETEGIGTLETAAEEAPVVKLVNSVIARAVAERASDIHIEPGEKDLRIRFRIDGVLHEVMTTPRAVASAVVSRVKIMSELNIAERRIPQDGRVSLRVAGRAIDVRTATLPGIHGEKVVMRILDKSLGVPSLDDLGFLKYNLVRYESSYTKPYGAILVTGPTGSGKTTTLYSTLDILNEEEVNIITVEDPVEYRLPGITQVQVNRKAGLLFANALKSILRSDPDIVLIGEIRDRETAAIATEAALTGHLVLSSLHTNDAASAIGRLTDMGVEPFLVSSAIDAVLAQRLARILCSRCREPYEPDEELLVGVAWDFDLIPVPETLYRAVGCGQCAQTGYRGRTSLNEVMLVTDEIQRLTIERRSSDELKRSAIDAGMQPLRIDGLTKVAAGTTSLEEILRVVV